MNKNINLVKNVQKFYFHYKQEYCLKLIYLTKTITPLGVIKGNKYSNFRKFEKFDYFRWPISLLASFILAYVFIPKAIIMNIWKDRDVSILYLSTKFELEWFTNNRDLSLDRKKLETHTNKHTHRD